MRLLLLYPTLLLLLGTGIAGRLLPANAQPDSASLNLTPLRISSDDTFVLVQGCVSLPGDQGISCSNPPQVDWQHHLDYLRDALHLADQQFAPWLAQHVRFVRARTAEPGPLRETLAASSANKGSIILLGHSAGGAAILNYLLTLRAGSNRLPPIKGAFMLDTPAARENLAQSSVGWWAAFDAQDQLRGLGDWAAQHGIRLLMVSYADDWAVNPLKPIVGVPHHLVPSNPAFRVGPWALGLKHNYFILDRNGARAVLSELFAGP